MDSFQVPCTLPISWSLSSNRRRGILYLITHKISVCRQCGNSLINHQINVFFFSSFSFTRKTHVRNSFYFPLRAITSLYMANTTTNLFFFFLWFQYQLRRRLIASCNFLLDRWFPTCNTWTEIILKPVKLLCSLRIKHLYRTSWSLVHRNS